MLNQRISHLLSNPRHNIVVQSHRVFNVRAQLRVAGWGLGNNHTSHFIIVITNDVCVSPSTNLNVRGQLQFLLYWLWCHPASLH